MKYLTLFFLKIEKMSKNLLSAAVLIGPLRVNDYLKEIPAKSNTFQIWRCQMIMLNPC